MALHIIDALDTTKSPAAKKSKLVLDISPIDNLGIELHPRSSMSDDEDFETEPAELTTRSRRDKFERGLVSKNKKARQLLSLAERQKLIYSKTKDKSQEEATLSLSSSLCYVFPLVLLSTNLNDTNLRNQFENAVTMIPPRAYKWSFDKHCDDINLPQFEDRKVIRISKQWFHRDPDLFIRAFLLPENLAHRTDLPTSTTTSGPSLFEHTKRERNNLLSSDSSDFFSDNHNRFRSENNNNNCLDLSPESQFYANQFNDLLKYVSEQTDIFDNELTFSTSISTRKRRLERQLQRHDDTDSTEYAYDDMTMAMQESTSMPSNIHTPALAEVLLIDDSSDSDMDVESDHTCMATEYELPTIVLQELCDQTAEITLQPQLHEKHRLQSFRRVTVTTLQIISRYESAIHRPPIRQGMQLRSGRTKSADSPRIFRHITPNKPDSPKLRSGTSLASILNVTQESQPERAVDLDSFNDLHPQRYNAAYGSDGDLLLRCLQPATLMDFIPRVPPISSSSSFELLAQVARSQQAARDRSQQRDYPE